nr:hypothetical protein MarFTME_341 [Marseillevirus futianmevirus]
MSDFRLVHNLRFSEIGETKQEKNGMLALVSAEWGVVTLLPVKLSSGKVKYPICTHCGTPVVWSYGACRCGKLEEKKSGEYWAEEAVFNHKTWTV